MALLSASSVHLFKSCVSRCTGVFVTSAAYASCCIACMTSNLSTRQVVRKLNEHIQKSNAGIYLSRIDRVPLATDSRFHLSESEHQARQASLEAFKRLPHHQKVDKSVSDRFLKELYPNHSKLEQFYTKFKSHNDVNHTSLYESYCELPSPGVAHMKYHDFEAFMKKFTQFRKWIRPSKLSSANAPLLKPKHVLQSYLDSLAVRREHLNALLHINRDMKMAGIPISNHERHGLVYKTFYRDRYDILGHVRASLPDNQYYHKAVHEALQKLPFDMDTYENLKDSFGDSLDTDTLNMFLFTALRHNNKDVYTAVLASYAPGSYNRDTFKILLENLAFHRDGDFLNHLELLVCEFPSLIDIRLVNMIIAALITRGEIKLAETVLDALLIQDLPVMEPSDTYLKLLSYEDKKKYNEALRHYDASSEKPNCILQPTPQTFLPFLQFYCLQKEKFSKFLDILWKVEDSKLPHTSQMFKYVYLSFTRNPCRLKDLQYMTGRLIEMHDTNNAGQDSWTKEVINEDALPERLLAFLNNSSHGAPAYDVNASKFVKLSSELMAVIFEAYKVALDREQTIRNEVLVIEEELNKQLATVVVQMKNQHLNLSKQEEITHMRKMSLIKLFDLGGSE